MKALIAQKYGPLEAVAIQEVVDRPATVDGEVLVRIEASSVNPLDLKLISGAMEGYFPLQTPFVVGTDFAGTVVEDAGAYKRGDRVFGRLEPLPAQGQQYGRTGAIAEFASVPSASLTALPEQLSYNDAAALPTAAGTAWQAIVEAGHVQAGQTILIHGGAGGVGGFAIQFAKELGARVITTASAGNTEYVKTLGADTVIDYQQHDFATQVKDADLVFDTIGGETQKKSFTVLRPGGLLFSTVQPPDEATAKEHNVFAAFVFHTTDAKRLKTIADKAVNGKLHIEIMKVYELTQATDALQQVAIGRTRGKIIVKR